MAEPAIAAMTSRPHYIWGGDCEGWHFVKAPGLSVIRERMPPGRRETRHTHALSRQFFFVLAGSLTLEVNGETFAIAPDSGLEIAPGVPHQAINSGCTDVDFLVISQPPAQGDRTPA